MNIPFFIMLAIHGPGADSSHEVSQMNPGYLGLQAIGSTMAHHSTVVALIGAVEKAEANHLLLVADVRNILDHRKCQFTEIDHRFESLSEQQQNMGDVLADLQGKQCDTFTALDVFKASIQDLNALVQNIHRSLEFQSCNCRGRSTPVRASAMSPVCHEFPTSDVPDTSKRAGRRRCYAKLPTSIVCVCVSSAFLPSSCSMMFAYRTTEDGLTAKQHNCGQFFG